MSSRPCSSNPIVDHWVDGSIGLPLRRIVMRLIKLIGISDCCPIEMVVIIPSNA